MPSSTRSSVTVDRLRAALETQVLVLREEQARTVEIQHRLDALKQELIEREHERDDSMKRQATLQSSILIYQDMLQMAEPEQQLVLMMGRERLVARLGEQHYRMLYWLREKGRLSLDDLASLSKASVRRVKAQMADDADEERRIVAISSGGYELTPTGSDLLGRFEDFRQAAGRKLPSLDPSPDEEDRGEAEPETHSDGGDST